jgi:selT/selW/selH-like putative selenoprotein
VANLIETRSSGALSVRGGDYPISESKRSIARYLSYAQIAIVGLLIGASDRMLPAVVRENKWSVGIFVWFIGNAISSALTNTGAFEIYLGEKLIWSTLKEGNLPNYAQLMDAFKQAGMDLS